MAAEWELVAYPALYITILSSSFPPPNLYFLLHQLMVSYILTFFLKPTLDDPNVFINLTTYGTKLGHRIAFIVISDAFYILPSYFWLPDLW